MSRILFFVGALFAEEIKTEDMDFSPHPSLWFTGPYLNIQILRTVILEDGPNLKLSLKANASKGKFRRLNQTEIKQMYLD